MVFIRKLAEAVEKEYPKERADASWDNTGILLEFDNKEESLLLCIDITEEVIEEAVENRIGTILAYHPVIFSPIKSITRENKILYRCINNKVSVYSPHTAFDGGLNGINHWISTIIPDTKSITAVGHIQIYSSSKSIGQILDVLDRELCLGIIRYSLGTGHTTETVPSVIAIGAGASSRPIRRIAYNPEIDSTPRHPEFTLVITGEGSHHDLLYFKKIGVSVILLEHSRSERGFLNKIEEYLKKEIPTARISISERDRDPVRFYKRE